MQEPENDGEALLAIANRLLPGVGRLNLERTAAGGSTPVYRIRRGGIVRYLRLAELPEASLAPEALAHRLLRERGVRVPEVVHFEPFDERLQRSLMATTEIPGRPLAEHRHGVDVAAVAKAAGRDLAIINGLAVDGFGWIRRDGPEGAPLAAELSTLRAFALGDVDADIAALSVALATDEMPAIRGAIAGHEPLLGADRAVLAHGDFDATHIYHRNGEYSGIIDFGEIRGADPFYDLGHAALHDGETIAEPLLPHLLAGYGEIAPLPPNHERRIHLWSLLIGIRSLARAARRPRSAYQVHLTQAIRRPLAALGR
ncbi:MAG TPA: aminoglycoside phosphotransferase family protein [Thermomicrobiales bacterium]|nr:aminoglycoside phosphotransferase family protein [Thermomicrobiales bacterium]